MALGNWDGQQYNTGHRVGFQGLLGAERAKIRKERARAALEAARDKMILPLVYFGTFYEPYGVEHIRVYWPTGEIDQHSTCRDCGGHIKRAGVVKWTHRCGCVDDSHVQNMRSQRKRRARRAEHIRTRGGITDYKMKRLLAEEDAPVRRSDDDYDL